mgnify:CR=1 FL=1
MPIYPWNNSWNVEYKSMGMRFIASALILCSWGSVAFAAAAKMDFWKEQRRGANLFNSVERIERLDAAKSFGIQVVRLAPNKWLNGRPQAELGDFLIGRPGSFKTINQQDLKLLRHVLDQAEQAGLKVVLTMLSLPGARWKQHNHGVEERAIWEDFSRQGTRIRYPLDPN